MPEIQCQGWRESTLKRRVRGPAGRSATFQARAPDRQMPLSPQPLDPTNLPWWPLCWVGQVLPGGTQPCGWATASPPQTQALSLESGTRGLRSPCSCHPHLHIGVKGSSHSRIKQGESRLPWAGGGEDVWGPGGRVASAFLILRREDLQKVPQPRGRKQESQVPRKESGEQSCFSQWGECPLSSSPPPTPESAGAPTKGERTILSRRWRSPCLGSFIWSPGPQRRPEPSASPGPRFFTGAGKGRGALPPGEISATGRSGWFPSGELCLKNRRWLEPLFCGLLTAWVPGSLWEGIIYFPLRIGKLRQALLCCLMRSGGASI